MIRSPATAPVSSGLKAPFPWFGGKSAVADEVWARFGRPKQYIEPFCGSAAVLLSAPQVASLEVIGDANCYVANFWRALRFRTDDVWAQQDYPVSHIDLYARHRWLTEPARVAALRESLLDPEWPGDPQIAGWWLWGQCCWIGSGWCEPRVERGDGSPGREPRQDPDASDAGRGTQAIGLGQIPHASSAGRGTQAIGLGKIPHAGNAGMGVQAVSLGKIPHASDAGRGTQAIGLGKIPHAGNAGMGVQAVSLGKIPHAGNAGARAWLHALARRLERVRVVHGDWSRCLNHHYGAEETAVFLDPPYRAFERLYGVGDKLVADDVAAWAREHETLRIALCGHRGDYDLPGWDCHEWSRGRPTYGGDSTTDLEAIWFSPGCLSRRQQRLFAGGAL